MLLFTSKIIPDYHRKLRVPVGGMQEMSFKITKLKVNFRLIGCVFYFVSGRIFVFILYLHFASGCICFVYISGFAFAQA